MSEKCAKCGSVFDSKGGKFRTCFSCKDKPDHGPCDEEIDQYLLPTYYDETGNLVRDIFIGNPQKMAGIFAKSKPVLTSKQLRDFYMPVIRARNKAIRQGISVARPLLWECARNLEYQSKRGGIPTTFVRMMQHHIVLAEKDERMLDGFCEYLESVIAYYQGK